MTLSPEIRSKLMWFFDIKKSAGVEVQTGGMSSESGSPTLESKVLTDGVTNEDLKVITLDKLQAFNDDIEGDFVALWGMTVAKITKMQKHLDKQPVNAMLKDLNEQKVKNASEEKISTGDSTVTLTKNETPISKKESKK